jgi:hypothetical protein
MSEPDFSERDQLRSDFAADFLYGRGIEIGGGAWPHRLPNGAEALQYDFRTSAELKELFGRETIQVRPITDVETDFPQGADFLIAHNVLEHSPNPIGQLIVWNGFVKLGGTVILSLPHYLYCPDARRNVAPLSHLITDYIEGSDGSGFVCREHGASFSLAWWEDFCRYNKTESVETFSQLALENLKGVSPDFHWHAYDSSLALHFTVASAALTGTHIELLRWWRPEAEETVGDILIAYKIVGRSEVNDISRTLFDLQARQREAMRAAVGSIEREIRTFTERSGQAKIVSLPLGKPFTQERGFCFTATIPAEFLSAIGPEMKVTVLENDRMLGPADTLHQTIRDCGQGAFSVWGSQLYFSSSDRSNCNDNGRQYRIRAQRVCNHHAASDAVVGFGTV